MRLHVERIELISSPMSTHHCSGYCLLRFGRNFDFVFFVDALSSQLLPGDSENDAYANLIRVRPGLTKTVEMVRI